MSSDLTVSTLKTALQQQGQPSFQLPDSSLVPAHCHITEIGISKSSLIDCGGTVSERQSAVVQLWHSKDVDHRLSANKWLTIIELAQSRLGVTDDLPVEVEYQTETTGKYRLGYNGQHFQLQAMSTDCPAKATCSSDGNAQSSCC